MSLCPLPWPIFIEKDRSSMSKATARHRIVSFLLFAFTLLMLFLMPCLTESGSVTAIDILQDTTITITVIGNTTSTSAIENQTTSTGTASSSLQLDLLIPFLVIGIGAGLMVVVAAVVMIKRRHARLVPTMQLVCPRCRAPVTPYDAACRNCHIPLYQPYRYYHRRR